MTNSSLTAAQQRRAKRYDNAVAHYHRTGDASGVIRCRRHPGRSANRSGFVSQGRYACGSCKTNRRADGSSRPAHTSNVAKRNYRLSMERRKHLQGRLRGMKLWERLPGMTGLYSRRS